MSTHQPGGPVKILELKDSTSEVKLLEENLDIVQAALNKCGANVVSIISVMGAYRTGKSFLLSLVLRYMRKLLDGEPAEDLAKVLGDEAALPDWFVSGDESRISEGRDDDKDQAGFKWRPGMQKCTDGIWLWTTPYVFTDKAGRKVAVLIMDTQGAFDNTISKAASATVFGLTALLSTKLIYNIQNRVSELEMENLDYITTFVQTACQGTTIKEAPFGHLELLVRDWPHYEAGMTKDECKTQMMDHMNDHISEEKVVQDAHERVRRLKELFRSISCFGLPHPGLALTKTSYKGEISAIDKDFIHLLDYFMHSFFGGDFPQAHAPMGSEVTVQGFKRIVVNFANAFADSAREMATGLRDAFVQNGLNTEKDNITKGFKAWLQKNAPDTSVVDPLVLSRDGQLQFEEIRKRYKEKLGPWRLPADQESKHVEELLEALNGMYSARVQINNGQIEGATLKLVASPVVGGGVYFLSVHTYILCVVGGGGVYLQMKRKAAREQIPLSCAPVFFVGLADDGKKFFIQVRKDVQAMRIAMNTFNVDTAVSKIQRAALGGISNVQAQAGEAAGNHPPPSNTMPVATQR